MTTFRDVLKKNRANIETIAHCNTHVNEDGQVTISKNDPWFYEDSSAVMPALSQTMIGNVLWQSF